MNFNFTKKQKKNVKRKKNKHTQGRRQSKLAILKEEYRAAPCRNDTILKFQVFIRFASIRLVMVTSLTLCLMPCWNIYHSYQILVREQSWSLEITWSHPFIRNLLIKLRIFLQILCPLKIASIFPSNTSSPSPTPMTIFVGYTHAW